MSHPDYWYSAKTALDWLLCHYAFEGRHVAWVAPDFDMYGTKNPESSIPHHLYHGSREYRIDDLQEPEFELLFAHFREDKELHDIILDGHGRGGYVEVHTLYELLDRRARLNP